MGRPKSQDTLKQQRIKTKSESEQNKFGGALKEK